MTVRILDIFIDIFLTLFPTLFKTRYLRQIDFVWYTFQHFFRRFFWTLFWTMSFIANWKTFLLMNAKNPYFWNSEFSRKSRGKGHLAARRVASLRNSTREQTALCPMALRRDQLKFMCLCAKATMALGSANSLKSQGGYFRWVVGMQFTRVRLESD